MKKFISFVTALLLTCSIVIIPTSAEGETPESIKVYLTITDIRDSSNPFNVIADRLYITVDYTDLTAKSQYLFNPKGLTVKGSLAQQNKITALHAIYSVHKLVYNNDADMITNLYLDSSGDITQFLGKITGAVAYRDSDSGSYKHPQNIEIHNNDEINICLYNYGQDQKVAVFEEMNVIAQRNTPLTLHLKEYNEAPQSSEPIADAQLTDEKGTYLEDASGNYVITDSDGEATLQYSAAGLYRVSMIPEIGFFKTTKRSKKTVEIVENAENPRVVNYTLPTYSKPEPMIQYTTPWANIHIDDTFSLDASLAINKQDGYSTIYVSCRNTDTLVDGSGVCPVVQVARFNQQDEFLGWVGDRLYTHHSTDGDTFQVAGKTVSCHLVNCISDVTVIVYSAAVDPAQGDELLDENVQYINQYEVTSQDGTLDFEFQSRLYDGEYKIIINKNGGAAITTIIPMYQSNATWEDMSYSLPNTIAQRTGLVAFQFNSYSQDVDSTPDNDTVYKVYCYKRENDAWINYPIYPPIILTPNTGN